MFSPSRILGVLVLVMLGYAFFYAGPSGGTEEGDFDPLVVAQAEAETWRALRVREDLSIYFSLISMEREQHRYSWFRAVQSGFYLGRATTTFVSMSTKFERVLPDLEEAAAIQKAWKHAAFNPVDVARAELDWWAATKLANLNTTEQVATYMAREYALRYAVNSDRLNDAAMRRAEALQLRDTSGPDPDWPEITKVLHESYRSLAVALKERRPSRSPVQ